MKIKMISLLSFGVLFFNTATAQKNIVTNGGFEDELFGWNSGDAKLTSWDFKSGKSSCAIITTNTDKWVGIDQIVKIPKKTSAFEVSAWLKTLNVVKGKNDWDGAIFTIVFLDSQDKEMGDGLNIARIIGDQPWTQVKKVIKAPKKAYSFKVLVAMGNASGSLLIDDVSVKALSPEDVAKL